VEYLLHLWTELARPFNAICRQVLKTANKAEQPDKMHIAAPSLHHRDSHALTLMDVAALKLLLASRSRPSEGIA